jgi:phytoene synthase
MPTWERPAVLLSPSEDPLLREARGTTRRVARTFSIACRLLPRPVRDDVYRLYLVFRTLDDLVDDGDERAWERVALVEAWCADDVVASREAALLADLDRRHPIPRDAMAEFCRGMWSDLEGAPMLTEADVERYCHRVAGTVGVVMSAVLGTVDDAVARPRAAALGCAMQRTNILRDIDEDLAGGRVYLARETLARFGPHALEPGSREGLLRDQIARADALYEEGIAGIPLLRSGRRAIAAAASMYREILRQIEREGYGAQRGRPVVARSRKLLVAARARG